MVNLWKMNQRVYENIEKLRKESMTKHSTSNEMQCIFAPKYVGVGIKPLLIEIIT